MFQLHPQLAKDTLAIGDFPLCRLLLMNDKSYPWFILVPKRHDITEIYQLSPADRQQLLKESCHLSEIIAKLFQADKINLAALGNMVPQLHIHHVVRYKTDRAWPKPIWGLHAAQPYTNRELRETCANLIAHLEGFTPDQGGPVVPQVC